MIFVCLYKFSQFVLSVRTMKHKLWYQLPPFFKMDRTIWVSPKVNTNLRVRLHCGRQSIRQWLPPADDDSDHYPWCPQWPAGDSSCSDYDLLMTTASPKPANRSGHTLQGFVYRSSKGEWKSTSSIVQCRRQGSALVEMTVDMGHHHHRGLRGIHAPVTRIHPSMGKSESRSTPVDNTRIHLCLGFNINILQWTPFCGERPSVVNATPIQRYHAFSVLISWQGKLNNHDQTKHSETQPHNALSHGDTPCFSKLPLVMYGHKDCPLLVVPTCWQYCPRSCQLSKHGSAPPPPPPNFTFTAHAFVAVVSQSKFIASQPVYCTGISLAHHRLNKLHHVQSWENLQLQSQRPFLPW